MSAPGRVELAGDLELLHGRRVLAAVSGGPDSTALLIWLVEHGVDAAAAHFDHALRAGSEGDAEHVGRLCARLGVELISERRRDPVGPGSLQAAARSLRYAFFERCLRASGHELVALAHTADDLVEGAVIHLLRGSALAGLRGMPDRRPPYVRPFLGVWRADVERYLRERGERPLEDPANRDQARFARARVRHSLLPRLERDRPGLRRRLWAAARAAARMQADLEVAAAGLGNGRRALAAARRPVRLEAYRQLFGSAGGRQPGLARAHLEAIDRLVLRGPTGSGLDLPGGLRFRVEPERVSIAPSRPAAPRPRLVVRLCPGCDEVRATHLRPGLELSVGHRTPGLRMRPIRAGAGPPFSRKLQDILTDAKVPRHLRDRLPLVFAGGRLVWVPGIAVDAAAAAVPGRPSLHVTLEDRHAASGAAGGARARC